MPHAYFGSKKKAISYAKKDFKNAKHFVRVVDTWTGRVVFLKRKD